MRIHIATDHAGLDFKTTLMQHLQQGGHDVVDHGAYSYDPQDDYPEFIIAAAQAVVADQRAGVEALGVVLGGSGNGEQMAANKVPGVRAALVWNDATATLAREHNDANVISIGARQHSDAEVLRLVDVFVQTPFSGDERHVRRIEQMATFEKMYVAREEVQQAATWRLQQRAQAVCPHLAQTTSSDREIEWKSLFVAVPGIERERCTLCGFVAYPDAELFGRQSLYFKKHPKRHARTMRRVRALLKRDMR